MPASSCDVFFSFGIRLIRRPSPPRPIGLVEPTLLLDREGFDVLRCCCPTVLDVRSHGPRPHGRSRVTLLVLAVFGARCDRCRCRASDKYRTENKTGTYQHGGYLQTPNLKSHRPGRPRYRRASVVANAGKAA